MFLCLAAAEITTEKAREKGEREDGRGNDKESGNGGEKQKIVRENGEAGEVRKVEMEESR